MTYKVLVVDDQKMQRKALEAYLSEMPDFSVEAVLPSAEIATGYCTRQRVDLVLMDIVMQAGTNGIDACKRIKRQHPKIKVILVTSMLDASYLGSARAAGADALWYKEEGDEELSAVCRRVMEGETVYPDCAPLLTLGNAQSREFTEGEMEILHELVKGSTDQEIADSLYVSVWTVRTRIQSLLQKTGYKNRVELAVKALSTGLISDA